MPSIWELLLVAIIILLLFGSGKIPALMKDFGKGINEFKKAVKGDTKEEKAVKKEVAVKTVSKPVAKKKIIKKK